MNTYRKNAKISGVLFFTATVAGFLSAGFLGTVLEESDLLGEVSANANQVLLGTLTVFIMGVAGASIAIPMYPILKKQNEGIALGAVVFRLIEGAIFMVGTIFLLLLIKLSKQSDASDHQTLSELLLEGFSKSQLLGGLAFSIGALMYYYLFYQSQLIPRWLSVWGLIGVTLGLVGYLIEFFTIGTVGAFELFIFHFLIFVQEMVFAVWLITKGFDTSVLDSKSV